MRSSRDSTCAERPSVYLLKPGSIKRDDRGAILDARSSVTMIISDDLRIVVDSGQQGDEKAILSALESLNLSPEGVDVVLNTHSHPDHCANNHLFSRARVLAAKDGETIGPGVHVMASPGHSPDSISVIVETDLTIVIAGDALPTLGNFQKNVPPALHTDLARAVASMSRIIEIADIVIPGHDLPFSLRKEAYVALPFPLGVKGH